MESQPARIYEPLIVPAALDPDAVKICRRLKRYGHEAYLVGGCVRDLSLGHIPKDFDVATSARPRQIKRLFRNARIIGRRFKLVHIQFGEKIIEVSTFRKNPSVDAESALECEAENASLDRPDEFDSTGEDPNAPLAEGSIDARIAAGAIDAGDEFGDREDPEVGSGDEVALETDEAADTDNDADNDTEVGEDATPAGSDRPRSDRPRIDRPRSDRGRVERKDERARETRDESRPRGASDARPDRHDRDRDRDRDRQEPRGYDRGPRPATPSSPREERGRPRDDDRRDRGPAYDRPAPSNRRDHDRPERDAYAPSDRRPHHSRDSRDDVRGRDDRRPPPHANRPSQAPRHDFRDRQDTRHDPRHDRPDPRRDSRDRPDTRHDPRRDSRGRSDIRHDPRHDSRGHQDSRHDSHRDVPRDSRGDSRSRDPEYRSDRTRDSRDDSAARGRAHHDDRDRPEIERRPYRDDARGEYERPRGDRDDSHRQDERHDAPRGRGRDDVGSRRRTDDRNTEDRNTDDGNDARFDRPRDRGDAPRDHQDAPNSRGDAPRARDDRDERNRQRPGDRERAPRSEAYDHPDSGRFEDEPRSDRGPRDDEDPSDTTTDRPESGDRESRGRRRGGRGHRGGRGPSGASQAQRSRRDRIHRGPRKGGRDGRGDGPSEDAPIDPDLRDDDDSDGDDLGDGSGDLLIRRDNVFGTAEEDAVRRDFTINALFYDVDENVVLDYVGGAEDLARRVIRTIGDPEIRFQEDPVRILRAIKFAARLGFTFDEATYAALVKYRGDLHKCAPPRLTEELLKILACGAAARAFELMRSTGVLETILPEINDFLERDPELGAHASADRDGDSEGEIDGEGDGDGEGDDEHLGGGTGKFAGDHAAEPAVGPTGHHDDDRESGVSEAAYGSIPEPSESSGDSAVTAQDPTAPGEDRGTPRRTDREVVPSEPEPRITAADSIRRYLEIIDDADRGRRVFGNATLFCALLLGPIREAIALPDGPRDPGMAADRVMRPFASRMAISRRDAFRVKQIVVALPRFKRPKHSRRRRRVKPIDLVKRDYFKDALDFYRIECIARGAYDEGEIRRWLDLYYGWLRNADPRAWRRARTEAPFDDFGTTSSPPSRGQAEHSPRDGGPNRDDDRTDGEGPDSMEGSDDSAEPGRRDDFASRADHGGGRRRRGRGRGRHRDRPGSDSESAGPRSWDDTGSRVDSPTGDPLEPSPARATEGDDPDASHSNDRSDQDDPRGRRRRRGRGRGRNENPNAGPAPVAAEAAPQPDPGDKDEDDDDPILEIDWNAPFSKVHDPGPISMIRTGVDQTEKRGGRRKKRRLDGAARELSKEVEDQPALQALKMIEGDPRGHEATRVRKLKRRMDDDRSLKDREQPFDFVRDFESIEDVFRW